MNSVFTGLCYVRKSTYSLWLMYEIGIWGQWHLKGPGLSMGSLSEQDKADPPTPDEPCGYEWGCTVAAWLLAGGWVQSLFPP